ncbi:MAG: glycine cleavage system protein H, partial [Candidatus Methanomethylicia archaeon]
PSLVNVDPYGAGWLVIIQPTKWDEEKDELLTAEEYSQYQQ